MTGYVGTKFEESYGIVVDFVDDELTELVRVRMFTLRMVSSNGLGPCD